MGTPKNSIRRTLEKYIPLAVGAFLLLVSLLDIFNFIDSPFQECKDPNMGLTQKVGCEIPSATLFLLAGITIFTSFEIERLHIIDDAAEKLELLERRTSELDKLDIDGTQKDLLLKRYAGIANVYERLSLTNFMKQMENAKEIRILQTWMPGFEEIAGSLTKALQAGASVEILLLHPYTSIAETRTEALKQMGGVQFQNVRDGVRNNLSALEVIARSVTPDQRAKLSVKIYRSLPSASIYRADNVCWLGLFFHGKLATLSPQIEIQYIDDNRLLANSIEEELDKIASIAEPINLEDWEYGLKAASA